LNRREPTRRSLSRAGNLVNARDTLGPSGRDQSSGTRSVEHCTAGASLQTTHLNAAVRGFAFEDEPCAWVGVLPRTTATATPRISAIRAFGEPVTGQT
jgi:hypothetical protein